MKVMTRSLRLRPGRIISQVHNGQGITVTYRGEPRTKIIPLYNARRNHGLDAAANEIFRIWKDQENMKSVVTYTKSPRKRRKHNIFVSQNISHFSKS